jgi:hypothetical protein
MKFPGPFPKICPGWKPGPPFMGRGGERREAVRFPALRSYKHIFAIKKNVPTNNVGGRGRLLTNDLTTGERGGLMGLPLRGVPKRELGNEIKASISLILQ